MSTSAQKQRKHFDACPLCTKLGSIRQSEVQSKTAGHAYVLAAEAVWRASRSSLAGASIMMHLVEQLQKLSSHQVRLGGLRFKLARVHTLLHNGACAGSCIRVCVCPVAMQGGM